MSTPAELHRRIVDIIDAHLGVAESDPEGAADCILALFGVRYSHEQAGPSPDGVEGVTEADLDDFLSGR